MAKAPLKTVTDTREQLQDDVEARIQALRDEIAALTKSVRDLGLQSAADAKTKARDIADDATAEALQAVKELRAHVDTLQSDVEDRVKSHPFAWLAGAVGLGVILGLILTRRD